MPKKAFRKKKLFQRHCLEQVRKGLTNQASGEWKAGDTSSMAEMMRHGYKIGRTRYHRSRRAA